MLFVTVDADADEGTVVLAGVACAYRVAGGKFGYRAPRSAWVRHPIVGASRSGRGRVEYVVDDGEPGRVECSAPEAGPVPCRPAGADYLRREADRARTLAGSAGLADQPEARIALHKFAVACDAAAGLWTPDGHARGPKAARATC